MDQNKNSSATDKVMPNEVLAAKLLRNTEYGAIGTSPLQGPNWKEMVEALSPEKQAEYDAAMIALGRRASPSMIAQELASVQPMPDSLDWDALGRAYAALVASHGKGPFIPRPTASMGLLDDKPTDG